MDDLPKSPPKSHEIKLLRGALAVAIAASLIAVWGVVDARSNTNDLIEVIKSQKTTISTTEKSLSEAQDKVTALGRINLESFLRQYAEHMGDLQRACDSYDKAKSTTGEGADSVRSASLQKLYESVDAFTDFITRWRAVAEPLNKLLDGNSTRLIDSRQVNNVEDVRETALRIVRAAPGLAEPLQVMLNRLKNIDPGNQLSPKSPD